MSMTQPIPRSLDELRGHVDGSPPTPTSGPPNHYHPGAFFRHDPTAGHLSNSHGQALFRLSLAEFDSLCSAVDEATLYRTGELTGLADLSEAVPRISGELNRPLEKVNLNRLLQTWWWPMRAQGWGEVRFDFSRRDRGLMVARLTQASGGRTGQFLAGLFASVLGYFAGRPLVGLALDTAEPPLSILISTRKMIRLASELRQQGTAAEALIDRLANPEGNQ